MMDRLSYFKEIFPLLLPMLNQQPAFISGKPKPDTHRNMTTEIKTNMEVEKDGEYNYEPGEEVEVMLPASGFENSFFAAKVVSKEGPSSYKVKYETLNVDDDSERLVEVIPADQLRPKPPHVPVSCFSLYELADVYEDEGWWAGIIYGKFKEDYFLYHPVIEEERSYPLESLRAHHEWRDGRWICHKAGV